MTTEKTLPIGKEEPEPPSAPGSAARIAKGPGRRSAAGTRVAGVAVALVITVAGVVCAQEALASASIAGLTPQAGWVHRAVHWADGQSLDERAAAAGIALVVLGALLLLAAWRRGPRPVHVAVAPMLELRAEDIARLTSTIAEDVDGVLAVSTSASTRSVLVRVRATDASQVAPEVENAVKDGLAVLAPAPRVKVRASTVGGETS